MEINCTTKEEQVAEGQIGSSPNFLPVCHADLWAFLALVSNSLVLFNCSSFLAASLQPLSSFYLWKTKESEQPNIQAKEMESEEPEVSEEEAEVLEEEAVFMSCVFSQNALGVAFFNRNTGEVSCKNETRRSCCDFL